MENNDIADIVRETRKQRRLTQRDIADVLEKTPATVSDIERGKIQISASDLSKIAEVLKKPIEHFFGVGHESEEVQDLIVNIRMQPKETQQKFIEQTKMLLSFYTFEKIVSKKDRKLSIQELANSANFLSQYFGEIETIYCTAIEFKKKIDDFVETDN